MQKEYAQIPVSVIQIEDSRVPPVPDADLFAHETCKMETWSHAL